MCRTTSEMEKSSKVLCLGDSPGTGHIYDEQAELEELNEDGLPHAPAANGSETDGDIA